MIAMLAASAVACKPPKQAAAPVAEAPAEQNVAEKYIGGLQTDLKRAQEAKEKADAANKRTDDSQKEFQQAEGQ